MHRLRAVKQGEPLFCFETLRLKSSARQRFPAFHSFAPKKCLTFANQGQSEMRERREIATSADRAFFRNEWADASVEHFAKHLDDFEADPTESESKHVGTQQHHRARLRFGKWIANSASVAANEVKLEPGQFGARYANIRQLAKTGAHAVNGRPARDYPFDDFTRSKNARACGRGDFHGRVSERHRGDLRKRQLLAVQFHLYI